MDRRYVQLDRKKLDYLRLQKGLAMEAIYDELSPDNLSRGNETVDKRRIKAVFAEEPVFVKTAKIVADYLGAPSLVSVLHADYLAEIGPPSRWGTPLDFFTTVGEWEAVQSLGEPTATANGLSYDVWKLRHRHVPNRFGRGKCYDLHRLSSKDRTRLTEHLTRHSQVCDRIGQHPHIARNRSAQAWEHAAYWWVIDDWTEGRTLGERLEEGSLTRESLPSQMRQIGEGLLALHRVGIVRRELSPRNIILRESDGAAILTDFELAKLTEGSATVSPQGRWPDDDYRAIEVGAAGGTSIDVRADVYSFGRILVHALCGELPTRGEEESIVMGLPDIPKSVRTTTLACVGIAPSERPKDITVVLNALKRWT